MKYTHFMQIFHEQVKKYGASKIALRAKQADSWREIDWKSFGEQVNSVSKALIDSGIAEQETVGIFSQNCPEWTIVDLASLNIRAIPVAIYATNTAKQAEYIVNDAEIKLIFVGEKDQRDKVLTFADNNNYLQKIVCFDDSLADGKDTRLVSFSDFVAAGLQSSAEAELVNRQKRYAVDDLLTFLYTSGTTGESKGVMLTHSNVIFQAERHDARLVDPNDGDVSLCFLPLSHVFERIWTYYVIATGMVNNYLPDPTQIIDFIQEVKPTVMCAVPRFYEKIYAAVFNKLETASPTKKVLFRWALSVGKDFNNRRKDRLVISPMLRLRYAIADKLVLKKIRELVGGRIKFFPCAGAPLSRTIEEFFYAVGIFVTYGYGLSETTATVTCHEPNNFQFGAVGKPLPDVEVKIDESNSEILIRGGNVMKGYYKKPEATAAVFTEDGFFRTGDAGIFAENGELIITDRIKDLMKTSGGKYIAPQMIESMLGADHFIEQVAVIGDQRKYVTALIVPSFINLEEYAQLMNISWKTHEDLIEKPEIVSFYQSRIDESTADLARYEKIKKFTLLAKEFTIEDGEITPTLKIKRKVIASKYHDIIEKMYAE